MSLTRMHLVNYGASGTLTRALREFEVSVKDDKSVVLTGKVELAGEWINGCNNNCSWTCSTGDQYLFGWMGTYEISIVIPSGSRFGTAEAGVSETYYGCCLDDVSACDRRETYSGTAHTYGDGFYDGEHAYVYFDYSDYPPVLIGLTLQGTYIRNSRNEPGPILGHRVHPSL